MANPQTKVVKDDLATVLSAITALAATEKTSDDARERATYDMLRRSAGAANEAISPDFRWNADRVRLDNKDKNGFSFGQLAAEARRKETGLSVDSAKTFAAQMNTALIAGTKRDFCKTLDRVFALENGDYFKRRAKLGAPHVKSQFRAAVALTVLAKGIDSGVFTVTAKQLETAIDKPPSKGDKRTARAKAEALRDTLDVYVNGKDATETKQAVEPILTGMLWEKALTAVIAAVAHMPLDPDKPGKKKTKKAKDAETAQKAIASLNNTLATMTVAEFEKFQASLAST